MACRSTATVARSDVISYRNIDVAVSSRMLI